MGIPRFSLPLRNWMIFWTLLASIGGGIAYDKHEQKQVRLRYMAQVEHLGQEKYTSDRLPRKISVFIAPPPNDFLEESVRHFRKYIKPLLNAAAIDFDVYTENQQGEIRLQVAEKIRQLRKETVEKQRKEAEAARQASHEKPWTKLFRSIPNYLKHKEEEEVLVSRLELYGPTDVLGLYKVVESVEPKRDNSDSPALSGGVICIGRGAYKEYINGIHEGLLGPLEAPAEPETLFEAKTIEDFTETGKEAGQETEATVEPETKSEDKAEEIDDFGLHEGEKKQPAVPKPFITPDQYPSAALAPELDLRGILLNDKKVPCLFEQPVYVFPLPHIVGFTNLPRKIYRYFTKRRLAESVSESALAVVHARTRPFEFKDSLFGKEEEAEWPKKWVARGKDKQSEWVQELAVDDRVTLRMSVYVNK